MAAGILVGALGVGGFLEGAFASGQLETRNVPVQPFRNSRNNWFQTTPQETASEPRESPTVARRFAKRPHLHPLTGCAARCPAGVGLYVRSRGQRREPMLASGKGFVRCFQHTDAGHVAGRSTQTQLTTPNETTCTNSMIQNRYLVVQAIGKGGWAKSI